MQIEPDVVAPRDDLDFFHSQTVSLPKPISALEGWELLVRQPLPGLSAALRIRDAVSSLFGVKPLASKSAHRPGPAKVGDRLGFFLIERIEPEILTLSARDRHLDTLTCITVFDQQLTITSSVKVHYWFGHLYMVPVAPAHRIIVSAMLRQASGSFAQA
ncbi:MAG TPA: DUF2867 domain-containing protein [Ramlibacter sp.]|jgi:hypothetical protein